MSGAGDTFHLGFDIDTSPLLKTAPAADAAAAAVNRLGDAEQKLAKDAAAAAQAATGAAAAAGQLKQQHEQAGAGVRAHADGTRTLDSQIKTATGNIRLNVLELQSLVQVMRGGGGMGGVIGAAETASGMVGRLAGVMGTAGGAAAGVAAGVVALAVAYYKLNVPLAEAQDKLAMLEARFKSSLGSTSAAKQAIDGLYETTQKTGLGFQSAADAFARLARNNETIGATRQELLRMTDTLQKLGAVSGATGGEISAGMLQLGQALASGRLQGDELRSVMENFPALAKAIADSLGVTIGQLRAMGATGELTGDKIAKAILGAMQRADREFAGLPDTVERANQRIEDSWALLLANLGQRWDSSRLVTSVKNTVNDVVRAGAEAVAKGNLGSQIADVEGIIAKTYGRGQLARGLASTDPDAQRFIKQREALLAQQYKEIEEARKATLDEEQKAALAPILRAQSIAKETDEFATALKKAREEAGALEDAVARIQIRMKTGLADQVERQMLRPLQDADAIAQAKLREKEASVGTGKLQQTLSDDRIAYAMAGGGRASMIAQALALQRAQQSNVAGGGGSVKDYLDLLTKDAEIKSADDVTRLKMQASAHRDLAAVMGETRDSIRAVEVANESKMYSFDKGVGATKRYRDAMLEAKVAADQFAIAQSLYQAKVGMQRAQTLLGADPTQRGQALAGLGHDIEREIYDKGMNEQEAAALRTRKLGEFFAGNANQDRLATVELERQAETLKEQEKWTGLLNDEWRVRLAMIAKEAELKKQGGMKPEDVTAQVLLAGESERRSIGIDKTRTSNQNVFGGQLQLDQIERQYRLIGLSSDEYRVQEAILKKELELRQRFVEVGSKDWSNEVSITEQIERRTIEWEKLRDRVLGIQKTFDDAAYQMKDVFTSALDEMFRTGVKNAGDVFGRGMSAIIRKLGAEMVYEIAFRPLHEFARQAAATLGSKLIGMLGLNLSGGASSAVGSVNADAGIAPSFIGANGGVFGFAAGGAFTNSIVSSPTLFRFAGGGSLGLMGEAGPEAIMPLKRGANGRLGVEGGGGGDVSVVINDMRSGGAPVQAQTSKGPDGRRMISLLIRDEMRRQLRSGDVDRDMAVNFGTNRQIARL